MSPGPAKQFDIDEALDQAVEVFWARGYEAASLSELLVAMGIGKKSLYDTFGNKRALFLAAVDRYADQQFALMYDVLQQPGSPLGNVRELLRMLQRVDSQIDSKGCLLGNNMADFDHQDGEIAGRLRHYIGRLEEMLYATLRDAQAAGELTSRARPRDLARMLVCMTQGMALISRVAGGGTMFRSVVTAAVALLES